MPFPCNPKRAAIALGSNVDSPPHEFDPGDRASHLEAARQAIGKLPQTALLSASRDYGSAPATWPTKKSVWHAHAKLEHVIVGEPEHEHADSGGGPYLNAAVTIETTLAPRALLDALLEIERTRGRDRSKEQRWGPRTLDLDLLLYADRVIDEPGLTIPHPRMAERLFVLEPLAEIAGDWKMPGSAAFVRDLLAEFVRAESQIEGKPMPGVTPGAG